VGRKWHAQASNAPGDGRGHQPRREPHRGHCCAAECGYGFAAACSARALASSVGGPRARGCERSTKKAASAALASRGDPPGALIVLWKLGTALGDPVNSPAKFSAAAAAPVPSDNALRVQVEFPAGTMPGRVAYVPLPDGRSATIKLQANAEPGLTLTITVPIMSSGGCGGNWRALDGALEALLVRPETLLALARSLAFAANLLRWCGASVWRSGPEPNTFF